MGIHVHDRNIDDIDFRSFGWDEPLESKERLVGAVKTELSFVKSYDSFDPSSCHRLGGPPPGHASHERDHIPSAGYCLSCTSRSPATWTSLELPQRATATTFYGELS